MKQKTAVITGASSGIGKAIASALQEKGCNILVNGRSCGSVYTRGPSLSINTDDLLEAETSAKLLDQCKKDFGDCDYLFVNAGMIESGSIEEIDIDKVCTMTRLKVESSYRLIYTFAKYFKARGKGHIFITSSILGTKVRETAGAYAGCNYALEALAEALRMELSDTDIQITCLEPGLVMTNLHNAWPEHPSKTFGIHSPLMPEDIAEAVLDILEKPSHVRIPRYMILPKGHRM